MSDRDLYTPSPEQAARIAAALGEGELLLWSARPRASDEVRRDATIWALPLFWMAFALLILAFVAYSATRGQRVEGSMLLAMLPFVAIGVWLVAAPWVARARAARAVYVLSDRRWMRFDGSGALPAKSIAIADLGPVESDEGADGFGALYVRLRSAPTGKGRSIVYWRCRGLPGIVELRRLIAARIEPR